MRKLILLLLLSLLAAMLGSGCKGKAQSARATADTYLALMKAENYDEAAKMWDYVTQARKDNEDWDNIQEGQRKLIMDKLAGDFVPSLKRWSGYFPAETKIAAVDETGDSAQAKLEGGRAKSLDLVKVGDQWKISGMQ